MQFYDDKSGRKVKATSLGFVGESEALSSLDNFRSFLSKEIHPEKNKSFSSNVRTAIKNGEKTKIWALVSESHVEAVTEREYYNRQP